MTADKWMDENGVVQGLRDKFRACWNAALEQCAQKPTTNSRYTTALRDVLCLFPGRLSKKFRNQIIDTFVSRLNADERHSV